MNGKNDAMDLVVNMLTTSGMIAVGNFNFSITRWISITVYSITHCGFDCVASAHVTPC